MDDSLFLSTEAIFMYYTILYFLYSEIRHFLFCTQGTSSRDCHLDTYMSLYSCCAALYYTRNNVHTNLIFFCLVCWKKKWPGGSFKLLTIHKIISLLYNSFLIKNISKVVCDIVFPVQYKLPNPLPQ